LFIAAVLSLFEVGQHCAFAVVENNISATTGIKNSFFIIFILKLFFDY
jgi:hypothetical protein